MSVCACNVIIFGCDDWNDDSTVDVLTRRPSEANPLGQSLEKHSEQYIKYLKNKNSRVFFFSSGHNTRIAKY